MQSKNFFDQFDAPATVTTKLADPRRPYEAPIAAGEAAVSSARVPYAARDAKSESDIKAAQAAEATRKNDEAAANARIAEMAPNSQLHGDAYLQKFVPPAMWNVVKAYARGDLGSRSGGLSQSMLPIIQHAMNYDPSASGTNFPARVKMQSDLASNQPGSIGGSLRATERMLLHGQEVLKGGAALDNFGPGLFGTIGNAVRTGYETATHDPKISHYNELVTNYAPEAQKAVAQTTGGEAERLGRAANFGTSMPQESRANALQADTQQALDATNASNNQYKRVMGHDILDVLSPEAKRAYDAIMAGGYDNSGKPLYPAAGWTPISGGTPGSPNVPPAASIGGNGTSGPSGPLPSAPGMDRTPLLSTTGNGTATPSQMTLSTGGTTTVPDVTQAAKAQRLAAMLADPKAQNSDIVSLANDLGNDPRRTNDWLQFRAAHPGVGGYDTSALAVKDVPVSLPHQVANTIASNPIGTGVINAGNAVSAGLLPTLTGDPSMTRAQLGVINGMNPGAATVGNLAGGAVAAMGLEGGAAKLGLQGVGAARAGDAAYGALSGFNGADPGDGLTGAAKGLVLGTGGGMLGRKVAGAGGSALTGVRDESVRYLADRGVPLTFGQAVGNSGVLGKTIKGMEDAGTSLPGVGDMINARRLEGVQGFNRAAINDAVAPVANQAINNTGEAGIEDAQKAVTKGYNKALDGVQVQADPQFVQDMHATIQRGTQLPDPMAGRMDYTLGTSVGNSFGPNGELTGNAYQQSVRGLQRDSSAVSSEPYGYDFGQVADDAHDALNGIFSRQAPGVMPDLNDANQAFRQTEIARAAVNSARNGGRSGETGLFMPSQLSDAAAANSRRFGNTQGTTDQPFFDLSRAGQNVLPSKLADSGTAKRLLLGSALPTLGAGTGYELGGTDGAQTGGETGLATLGALALGGSKWAQKALTASVLNRPQSMVNAGQSLKLAAPYFGAIGAGGATAGMLGSR